ncbi:tetratricopeptide repeat protein [Pseudanabaena sp. PCC 6802]|uniref:tetratricopeptide repeat protein n=1 Tax=Pseudanabaena sp. PCC 6802 TaxID=118173 RepID=UPI0003471798|nr:tetratricopeptide repeat protein [Pseudanabaena sp. PCC 6802]
MQLDYLQTAKDYLTSGNTELAIANLTKALAVDPDLAEAHYQLGVIQAQQNKLDNAILCFRRAIALEPQYTDALYNLGNALAQSGQHAEAIATYKQVIELQPDHINAYLNLGVVHFQNQNFASATSCCQKALEIDPKNIRAYHSLATIFTNQGMLEKSIESYQQAIALIAATNSESGKKTQSDLELETNLYVGLGNSCYLQKHLEQSLQAYQQALALYSNLPGLTDRIREIEWTLEIRSKISEAKKTVLHVGCGPYSTTGLHLAFQSPEWQEIRFDIDPGVQPDIVGTLTDMTAVGSNAVNAIWSSHNIEHLYPHEVPIALKECYRVLKPGGLALITLPDLQKVAEFIAEGKLETPLYNSPSGGISALDIIYGLGVAIANGNYYMAHRTGFTAETLRNKLVDAGFIDAIVCREGLNLWAKAYKPNTARLGVSDGLREEQFHW